ncbi:MAG: EAL domain-containing protein [Arcobacter sp.]|nr:EAL domain-containing protein [Arcobacter sp.]
MFKNVSILKNLTILYAEDEQDLREVTHQILKGFTKKQYVASNGQEGLELFTANQQEIDLIITDVNMPIMNGLEMVRKIKEINMNIPIIVATAFSNKEYLLEAIDIGVDKYVLKPVDIEKLLQVMSQSLLYHELKDLYTDELTKLPNRNKLNKDLIANKESLIALVDIDKFSTINDLFGEENGNKILLSLTNLLSNFFNLNQYTVYRTDADRFVVMDYNNNANLFYDACKRFIEKIEKNSLFIDENEIDVDLTIGIAQGKDLESFKYAQRVIKYARNKMQKIMIYNDCLNIQKSFEENIKWIKEIKYAFRENLFQAYFQPIIDTQTEETYKYEALLRYIDKDGKEIPAIKFLDVIKRTKLYSNIIKIILKDAFKLIIAKDKRVSINISYNDISNKTTTEFIYELLERYKEHSHMLEFEILESEEISNFDEVINFIKRIKEFNCTIGIDDFGSGYSNFNLLTLLNIDFVKIDGSLIENINDSKELEIIVTTIVNFSKEFKVKTIAEFVSNEEIYKKMKELEIDYCQGWYFQKAMSYDSIK